MTTSLIDPLHDFEVNARGTLKAVRRQQQAPFVLYTSTNKVYGALEDVVLADAGTRYAPVNPAQHRGVSEARGLAFHSPYGCSKGGRGSAIRSRKGKPGHEGWGTVGGGARGPRGPRG